MSVGRPSPIFRLDKRTFYLRTLIWELYLVRFRILEEHGLQRTSVPVMQRKEWAEIGSHVRLRSKERAVFLMSRGLGKCEGREQGAVSLFRFKFSFIAARYFSAEKKPSAVIIRTSTVMITERLLFVKCKVCGQTIIYS